MHLNFPNIGFSTKVKSNAIQITNRILSKALALSQMALQIVERPGLPLNLSFIKCFLKNISNSRTLFKNLLKMGLGPSSNPGDSTKRCSGSVKVPIEPSKQKNEFGIFYLKITKKISKTENLKDSQKTLENNPNPLENNSKSMENNPKYLENNRNYLVNNQKSLENNPKSLENNPKSLENNRKSLENNLKPTESNLNTSEKKTPDSSENNPNSLEINPKSL